MPILRTSVWHRRVKIGYIAGVPVKTVKVSYSFKCWGPTFAVHHFLQGAKIAIPIFYYNGFFRKNYPYGLYMSEII